MAPVCEVNFVNFNGLKMTRFRVALTRIQLAINSFFFINECEHYFTEHEGKEKQFRHSEYSQNKGYTPLLLLRNEIYMMKKKEEEYSDLSERIALFIVF